MEKTKKPTKLEMYERVLARLTEPTEIDFIKHQMDLLKSKNANRKQTTTQKENEDFKYEIMTFLLANEEESFSIEEIQTNVQSVAKLSNQRMSAILKQMVDSEDIFKTYEKRKAYFSASRM